MEVTLVRDIIHALFPESQPPAQDVECISEMAEHHQPNEEVYGIMLAYCLNNPLEEVQV